MEPYFERVESHLGVGPSVAAVRRADRRGDAARLRRARLEARALLRNAPGCEASGFCHLGCRSDARKSTNLSYLPPALERGALLFTGLKAERVLVENGRATGLEGIASERQRGSASGPGRWSSPAEPSPRRSS